MKNYNKPNLEIVKIAPATVIADDINAGLANWLSGNGLQANNLENITAFEYVSE